jgi:hypothetical protein
MSDSTDTPSCGSLWLSVACIVVLVGCTSPPSAPIGDYCSGDNPGFEPGSVAVIDGICPFSDAPCAADYVALESRAAASASPISETELWDQLLDLRHGRAFVETGSIQGQDLRDRLLEAANLGFLLEQLEDGVLEVTELEEADDAPGIQRSFLVEDPYVGQFRGLSLKPHGEGPFPTLIIAHGHEEYDQRWIDRYGGWELVELGYAVIVPTLRVNGAAQVETDVTLHLLRGGFTMMALRVYETLLVTRYAASLPHVDPCRIALIGHSGGSVASNITARISGGFAAYVSDLQSVYYAEAPGDLFIDETSPALHALHPQINDFDTHELPTLKVGYRYETATAPTLSEWPRIYEFLDEYLGER